MQLARLAVGSMDNNAYLLTDSGEGLLVDAADDALALLALIGDVPLSHLVTTHRHHDHLRALADLAHHTGARLAAGTPDSAAIEAAAGVIIDDRVWDGDTITFGGVTLDVIGLVGHTPGSIALAYTPADGPAQLFTGDSLFPGGVGATQSPADFASLLSDVTTKLFDRFDDDTEVWPGHGEPTTLGAERPQLDAWLARGW